WSRSLNRTRGVTHSRNLAIGGVIAMAACVSLSRPSGPSRGNVPIVRGTYKTGAEQLVGILLATPDSGADLGSTGDWAIFPQGADQPIARFAASQTVHFPNRTELPTDRGILVARPTGNDSFITWAGKRYRGELVMSAGDSGVVNRVSMDSYLRGVVPLEIGNRTSAEVAAVQAQAVAARTYAYKHLTPNRSFDMYATVQDQVYGGVDAEKPQSDSAIATTADIVVLYNGQPISTPYHSTCGGSTAAVTEVWYNQPDEPYLRPVSDRIPGTDHFYCDPSPRFAWTQSFDADGLR